MSTRPFDVDQFLYRVIRDAMNEATAAYWRRRAHDFEAAVDRPGDYLGRSTHETRAERRRRLHARAEACRNRATLCELTPDEERIYLDLLEREVWRR